VPDKVWTIHAADNAGVNIHVDAKLWASLKLNQPTGSIHLIYQGML
jgi:hypothetical protein